MGWRGTVFTLIDDITGCRLVLRFRVSLTIEERVHVDEGRPYDHKINERIEQKQYEEDNPLISVLIADGLECLLDS